MATYTPILRWKRGERVALQKLSPAAKIDTVPLVVILPDQYVGRAETPLRPAMSAAEAFASEFLSCWGTAPFFLDASALSAGLTAQHPLISIATAARNVGLQLIPASKLGAPTLYRNAIAAVTALDGRGAGLRVDLQEFTTAAHWVSAMIVPPTQTHLIADFAENVGMVSVLGQTIVAIFNSLHLASSWLSVTVAGCSLPENYTGYAAGQHLIQRAEWHLWQTLQAGVTYPIQYGDYATVPPSSPPPGIRWGFPINVKYTLDSQFLVCRGVKTTGPGGVDMDIQLRNHALSIRAFIPRHPLGHCWADPKIDRIVLVPESPGNLETWVQIGVNRHIEKVRADLP